MNDAEETGDDGDGIVAGKGALNFELGEAIEQDDGAGNERGRETRRQIEFLWHLDEIFPDCFGAGGADSGQFRIAANIVSVFPAALAFGAACAG